MKIVSEEEPCKQNAISTAENEDVKDNDEAIDDLTRRKDVLNNVLEKLIDKINQPPKAENEL